MSDRSPWRALIAVVFLTLAGSGCENGTRLPPGAQAYGAALAAAARTAELPFTLPDTPQRHALRYPKGRALVAPMPTNNINLIEFLRLSSCELNRVVAAHNSVLSRLQDRVEALFYAAEFVVLADLCIDKSPVNTLTRKLANVQRQKRNDMPLAAYNAIFPSREMRRFFSPYATVADFEAWLVVAEGETDLDMSTPGVSTRDVSTPDVSTPEASTKAIFVSAPAKAIAELGELVAELAAVELAYDFDAARSRFDLALGDLAEFRYGGAVLLYGVWLDRLAEAAARLEAELAHRGRCDLVAQMAAPRAAFMAELAQVRRGRHWVRQLLALAPTGTPVQRYASEHWAAAGSKAAATEFAAAEACGP